MSKQIFFDKCLERDPSLNRTAVTHMSPEFQNKYIMLEKIIRQGTKNLALELNSELGSAWSNRILKLSEAYDWHCIMTGDMMFQLGAELMEKEIALNIWRKR